MTSHKCEEYNYGASTAPNLSRWPTNGRKHDGRIRSTERNDQGAKAVAPTALSLKTLSTVAVFVLLCTSALYAYWGSPGVRGSLGSNSRLWPSELPCGILCDKAKAADTTTLIPFTFRPLPLGSIKPQGWLRDQMVLMANGLAGHEYDFYDIVKDSPWLGGSSEYSSLYEGFPYWFNGLVPLAYGLDDGRLKAQVHNALGIVLGHQQADGWLGPEKGDGRDHWGRFPFFLGLMQLVEANSSLADTVVPSMHRYIKLMHSMLRDGNGLNEVWGRVRYADMIICLQWLYERFPENNEKILLESMHYLKNNSLDWAAYYDERNFIFNDLDTVDSSITDAAFGFVHAVNAGQGLKTGAVNYRFTRNQTLLQNTRNGVNWTFTYHGAPSGTILGDEREAGLSPTRGSELCTAVETMYSMSYLYQMLGDNGFADRCELVAFNALPVMFTPDHWAHQYVAAPNQPYSRPVNAAGLFWNVGDYALTYGLEPNYPCCTVNFPQGYPKFLSASFVRVGRNGLGHALLMPSNVSTVLPDGTLVAVSCDTNYPFGNTLHYTVDATNAFDFYVRVPQWATDFNFSLDSHAKYALRDPHSGIVSVRVPAGKSTIVYELCSDINIEHRANSTVAIHHGPLLYALDVGHSIEALPPHYYHSHQPFPPASLPTHAHDYIVNNTRPWNIAIDSSTLAYHLVPSNSSNSSALPNPIWGPGAPPGYITAKGCQIHWPVDHGVPAPVPLPGNRSCMGKAMEVVFRPYGSLKVHMAELPTVNLTAKDLVDL